MADVVWLLLAVAAAYGCGLVAPFLRLRGRFALLSEWWFFPVILVFPLLVPSHHVHFRAVAALFSTDLTFRIVDYFRHTRHTSQGFSFREYFRFLVPFPILWVVFNDHRRRPLPPHSLWPTLAEVLGGAIGVASGFLVLHLLSENAILRTSFPLDHAVKVLLFVLTIESLSRMLHGLERLAGFDTRPIVDNAFWSRTVSEFWQRYNNRVHDWLYVNVFRPSGGRRAPVRGILLVFLVSGLLHELTFGIATSRLDGYQLAFFLLQVPAVLASRPVERLANRRGIVGKTVAHALTILWLSVSSVFFFHGVHKIFPIVYVSESWLAYPWP